MSTEHVNLVRAAMEDWNRGDISSARERLHPDVEWLPIRAATEGAYRGTAGLDAWIADTLEVFESFELRYELAPAGDRVLAWGVIHLQARGSGIETDIESGGVFEFRDGKIVRWEDFGSKEQAMAALEHRA